MRKPLVAVASLGGTITMTSETGNSVGVTPTLGVEQLLATVPGLGDAARLQTKTLAGLPGASLGFADVLEALMWARTTVEAGADGVVLVQGTDTLEETAYLLDLHWERPEPIVVTGAMRAPQTAGSDGPANLLAAVLVAGAKHSRHLGVLVVMNDEVHAAARVRKVHSTAVEAFRSPTFGPLGQMNEGGVAYGNRPVRWPHLPLPTDGPTPRVALLETCLGDTGSLLTAAVDAGYDGAVIGAFGVGHVSAAFAEVISKATEVLPVVLATRTGAGTTLTRTYGFVGSESDLLKRGVIPAGWLDPRKARILLWSLLASQHGKEEIQRQFAMRGGHPGGAGTH